jgi:hypothetical protein
MHIPFHTLAERHLVYVYATVILLHLAYVSYVTVQWNKTPQN